MNHIIIRRSRFDVVLVVLLLLVIRCCREAEDSQIKLINSNLNPRLVLILSQIGNIQIGHQNLSKLASDKDRDEEGEDDGRGRGARDGGVPEIVYQPYDYDSTKNHDTALGRFSTGIMTVLGSMIPPSPRSQHWYHRNNHMAGPTIMTVLKSIIVESRPSIMLIHI